MASPDNSTGNYARDESRILARRFRLSLSCWF